MAALRNRQTVSFWGLGGDRMVNEGLEALYHVKDLSVTGFVEVLKHLSFFREVMAAILRRCREEPPEAAILLDYPGFNLRLGQELKKLNIPVFYYISPQVWAWKKGRVKRMRQFIRRIFVIFPFEEAFYREQGIPVSFTGHPLVDQSFNPGEKAAFFQKYHLDPARPLVAILPGSRRNELQRHTPVLLETIQNLLHQHPRLQFAVAALSSLDAEYYEPFELSGKVKVVQNASRVLTAHADVAIVASGTASLETAYQKTPLVVIYKIAPVSFLIGKLLVDIEHLAMPNLILSERAIPEFIQGEATPERIAPAVLELLENGKARQNMLEKLEKLQGALGEPGCATKIADQILNDLAKA